MPAGSQGWPFLVARGRRTVYRTVLAPGFLVELNLHHRLPQWTDSPDHEARRARVVHVQDGALGPLSIAFRRELLTREDVDGMAPGGERSITDEHGRPLELTFGFVSRERLAEPVDEADLRTAREHALRAYGDFLADEPAHRVAVAAPFSLQTAVDDTTQTATLGPTALTPAPSTPARRTGSPSPAAALRSRRPLQAGAIAIGCALIAAGVLTTTGGDPSQPTAASPAWLDEQPSGPVRLCAAEGERSAPLRQSLAAYNRRATGSRATLAALNADVTPAALRATHCDAVLLGVSQIAQFAANDQLYDLTAYLEDGDRGQRFNAPMLRAVRYADKLWGVPKELDAGVLYYRRDRVRPPSSWRDLYRQATPASARAAPGLRVQASSSDDVTVFLLELAYAAGARPIVSADGHDAHIAQPQMLAALRFLRDAVRDRVMPPIAPADPDRAPATAYEAGEASFLRADSSVARRLREAGNAVAQNTTIVALPPWRAAGERVAVLRGQVLVIPRSADNPSAALHLIDALTSAAQLREDASDGARYPVLASLAEDPALSDRPLISAIKRTKLVLLTAHRALRRGVADHLQRRGGGARRPGRHCVPPNAARARRARRAERAGRAARQRLTAGAPADRRSGRAAQPGRPTSQPHRAHHDGIDRHLRRRVGRQPRDPAHDVLAADDAAEDRVVGRQRGLRRA